MLPGHKRYPCSGRPRGKTTNLEQRGCVGWHQGGRTRAGALCQLLDAAHPTPRHACLKNSLPSPPALPALPVASAVTACFSIEAARSCIEAAQAVVSFDVVLLDASLLAPLHKGAAAAFFRQAAAAHAPVVLMAGAQHA